MLKEHRIFQSMSRKGNCHDNSVMENFFGLLKQEIYYGQIFNSYQELSQAITSWISYYNTKRIKKKLNWIFSCSISDSLLKRLKNPSITTWIKSLTF
jgi:transposase InsO family protein